MRFRNKTLQLLKTRHIGKQHTVKMRQKVNSRPWEEDAKLQAVFSQHSQPATLRDSSLGCSGLCTQHTRWLP